ncbi:MAG: hypothetical protein PHH13_03625 [Candidatus Peribacteraceae bacterium]|nr:hypothetical protein [Candidatus Peribacteraceae bacterium]
MPEREEGLNQDLNTGTERLAVEPLVEAAIEAQMQRFNDLGAKQIAQIRTDLSEAAKARLAFYQSLPEYATASPSFIAAAVRLRVNSKALEIRTALRAQSVRDA